jgi:hypothetical protein
MEKTLIDIMLTHTLLDNIINLENIITKKDSEIVNLKKEIKRLKTLVSDLTERNTAQPDNIHNYVKSMFMPLNASNDAMQYITNKYNNKVENLYDYNKNINQGQNIKVEKDKSYFLDGRISLDETDEAQLAIFTACEKLCAMLIRKNKVGENSTVAPLQLLQAFIHIVK